MNETILCIDDDPVALLGFRRDLKGRFNVVTAPTGEDGLKVLTEQGPFGVLIADMMMPGMNGIEVLAQAQKLAPDTVRIMLTGDEDKQTAIEAINPPVSGVRLRPNIILSYLSAHRQQPGKRNSFPYDPYDEETHPLLAAGSRRSRPTAARK